MKEWTGGWIIAECIGGIVAVVVGLSIGFGVGNSDWLNKPERVARYSQTIITPEIMTEAGERFTAGAAIINSEGKKLRDAIGQQRDINNYRLWREMREAEEKALLERMARIKKVEVR